MEQFAHLKFVQKITGRPRLFGGPNDSERTLANKNNRQGHSNSLLSKTSQIKSDWNNDYEERTEKGLAPIDKDVVPVLLQMNPDLLGLVGFDLMAFGIEIISEEDDGYILGASLDNLRSLEQKINDFISEKHGSAKIGDLWEIVSGNRYEWKPERVLSEALFKLWPNQIQDDEVFNLEVSIAFDKPLGPKPDPSKKGGKSRLHRYNEQLIDRDTQLMAREDNFQEFINHHGKITSSLVQLGDSFCCEVEISGEGLKDLVKNYQYVFEITEIEKIGGIEGLPEELEDFDIEILVPDADAQEVGVIDSGIMEEHKYLALAIKQENSKSYIPDDNSKADYVKGGGHGTKVAGAILYPKGITNQTSPYQLPCFVRNIRVLDKDNFLITKYPAELMIQIVEDNVECGIFNLSISAHVPFRKKHMSSWAAVIDKLIHEKNVLFITSAGNVKINSIQDFFLKDIGYPTYLSEPNCRLANPAQSCFGLTVGSINHNSFEDDSWKSIGDENEISAYSRIGFGIWGAIKPDVVEFGGGLISSKDGLHSVKESAETSTELIRSTFHGGNALGRSSVGTSFSTPKVTHIAACLKRLYPDENVNLLRGLVVQGARLPNEYFRNPTKQSIQHFGYGLPSLDRVTKNTEHRITFYNTGNLAVDEGHIYSLKIPEELRSQANEYEILIEVTLAYTAEVRRTRQKTKSYLSTWLDWTTSKLEEPFDDFADYALKETEEGETTYNQKARKDLVGFDWKIKVKSDAGVEGLSRNNSTVQKDWAIIKSFQLPDEIGFAVRAHKGWDKSQKSVPYSLVVSIELLGAEVPIYQSIRVANEQEIEV